MKKLIFLLPLFLLSGLSAQQNGFVMEYKLDGTMIGNTKIDGNLEMVVKSHVKKISGNIVYEEPGNPYPTLDEQEILIDFDANTKYHKTSESHGWLSGPVDVDYTHISDAAINKSIKKDKGKDIITITVSLPVSLGGTHTYTIELDWQKPGIQNEIETFTKIGRPSATDFLSLFIDNEKIVEQVGKLLADDRYVIPDSFSLTIDQAGKIQQTIKGTHRSTIVLVPSDKWFKVQ